MGYWEKLGGIWSSDYLVIDVEKAQRAKSIKEIRLYRTRDIFPRKVTTFFLLPTVQYLSNVTPSMDIVNARN